MDVLILGGTQFIGRHIVETLLAAGHRVSIFNRGKTPDELPAEVERLRGDRDAGVAGLQSLAGRTWDACVDVSGYTARQVRSSVEQLRATVKRYVYISAVSVYGDPQNRPVSETYPCISPAAEDVTEIDDETYGRLKVTCEHIVQEVYADKCTLLRPQVVVGPHDASGRYAYWVQRAVQGGEMLAPGDGADHLQVIDVRDLARFTRRVIENDIGGIFNLSGPRLTWAEFMHILSPERMVWVSAEIIAAARLTFVELPLFRPEYGARSSLMDVSNDRARTAGLILTPPEVSVNDMRAWLYGKEVSLALAPEREAELIRIARQRTT